MSFFRKEIGLFEDFIYDSTIDLKDRSFVVFSIAMIVSFLVSVPCGVIMKEPVSATIMTLVGSLIFTALVLAAYMSRKIRLIRMVTAVLAAFVLLPGLLITNGGVNSGAPLWVLLGFYYLVMITDGKFRSFLSVLTVFILLAYWQLEYWHPELVTQYARWSSFFDCFTALITALLVIAFIVSFQTRLYKRERRIAEEKARELEELNRSQNRFFSSMSHEIRTPINTVLGMNELILRQEDASEEIRRDARNIQGAGKLLLALINDILDISKIEAGKMDIVPVSYRVASLLSEIVNMIWLKAEEKGLKFHVDIDPDVPETLFGDEVRIKQILINLLNNAVKYTNEGSISLHMECEYIDREEVLLTINVSDTGIGIRAEALPHLFDTFRRVDEEKNRHIEGTGLGLSIVKQLVELMGGQVAVNSVYSQGSSFSVTFRQGVSSQKHIGDLKITSMGYMSNAEKFEHSFHAPDARILIVDDNEMNLEVEKKLLDGTGMTTDLALSGQEALVLTAKNRYDVIFMDHLMPEMDGIECFKRIRAQKGGLNAKIPMIVLTANAGGENIELYNNTGFDGYLLKPVSGRQLEEVLLTCLPSRKVMRSGISEMTGASLSTASGYAKKKGVAVATGSMSDLPGYILRELEISVIPSKIITEQGVFFDNIDIDSEEILRYMGDGRKLVLSDAPTEEEYIRFFSSELTKAHNLIFITLTSGNSYEYERASRAASAFENVTVINSECVSSATGMLAMAAAKLAQQNLPVERIIAELEEVKKQIRCSFVIKTTDVMARRQRISPFMNNILNTLWLRPMLHVKDDKLSVGKIFWGDVRRCYEKYIKGVFPANTVPDTSFVFVTYAGMDEEELVWIEEKLGERKKFDHIIFQKASAGITTNCGEGTFGILYMTKSEREYNLGAIFDRRNDGNEYIDLVMDEENTDENTGESFAKHLSQSQAGLETEAEPNAEAKWYEKIKGIDGAEAIKNSGSEESLGTVLKIFCESIGPKSEELEEYYSREDWKNYTIKVHALKSSAKLIGAIELSEAAQKLEMAGKAEDADYIRTHHDSFMEDYAGFGRLLSGIYKESEEDVKKTADDSLIERVYEGMREAAEAMDYDMIEGIFAELDEYAVPEPEQEKIAAIRQRAEDFDYDGILQVLDSGRESHT